MSDNLVLKHKIPSNIDNQHVQLATVVMAVLTAEGIITFRTDNRDSMALWGEGIVLLARIFELNDIHLYTWPHIPAEWNEPAK